MSPHAQLFWFIAALINIGVCIPMLLIALITGSMPYYLFLLADISASIYSAFRLYHLRDWGRK